MGSDGMKIMDKELTWAEKKTKEFENRKPNDLVRVGVCVDVRHLETKNKDTDKKYRGINDVFNNLTARTTGSTWGFISFK